MSKLISHTKKIIKFSLESKPVKSIRRKAYDKKFENNQYLNLFKGVFSTFEEAQKATINQAKPASYDNQDSASMYKDFATKLFPQDYPNLFWIQKNLDHVKSLYDFGGHIGIKYYSYNSKINLPAGFNWFVHDLPAVMTEGRRFAQEKGVQEQLRFSETLLDVANVDFFMALGSLQYVDIDFNAILGPIEKKPKYILVTTPTSKKKTYYTINSIGTAQCPYIIRNEDELVSSIIKFGYQLKDRWDIPNKRCEIPFNEEYSLDSYSGYYFELSL